jgi:hypothetical protein
LPLAHTVLFFQLFHMFENFYNRMLGDNADLISTHLSPPPPKPPSNSGDRLFPECFEAEVASLIFILPEHRHCLNGEWLVTSTEHYFSLFPCSEHPDDILP